MAKKRRLGAMRGLDALLNSSKVGRQVVDVIDDAKSTMGEQAHVDTASSRLMPNPAMKQDQASRADEVPSDAVNIPDAINIAIKNSDYQADGDSQNADTPKMADADPSADGINIPAAPSYDAKAEEGVSVPSQQTTQDTQIDHLDIDDPLSSLPAHQQRDILLFWQHGLSMDSEAL